MIKRLYLEEDGGDWKEMKNAREFVEEMRSAEDRLDVNRFTEASTEDISVANELYEQLKPELSEEDEYELVNCVVTFPTEEIRIAGIRYILNGEIVTDRIRI